MIKVIPALLGLVLMTNVSAFAAAPALKNASASAPVKTQIKKSHKKHSRKCVKSAVSKK